MLEYNPTKIQWILYIHNYSNYDIIILYDKKIYSENVTEYLCRYFAWNKNFANRQNYYYALFIITQLLNMCKFKTKMLIFFTMGGLEWLQTQENHLRPAATWVISSRKIISKMAADSGSLFFANFSNVLGWTSSPLKTGGDIFQWTCTSKQYQSQHPNAIK